MRPRKATFRNSQRGMTILEIMIVLAILALVMGFLIGPRIMRMFSESKSDIARMQAKDYAGTAFSVWQTKPKNKGKPCPDSLADLNEYASGDRKAGDIKDPWGYDFIMLCGDKVPAAAGRVPIAIQSVGEDGKLDTDDDVRSWE
jgi:general secretion pathway protein G